MLYKWFEKLCWAQQVIEEHDIIKNLNLSWTRSIRNLVHISMYFLRWLSKWKLWPTCWSYQLICIFTPISHVSQLKHVINPNVIRGAWVACSTSSSSSLNTNVGWHKWDSEFLMLQKSQDMNTIGKQLFILHQITWKPHENNYSYFTNPNRPKIPKSHESKNADNTKNKKKRNQPRVLMIEAMLLMMITMIMGRNRCWMVKSLEKENKDKANEIGFSRVKP